MAERRMFAKTIVLSDAFLDMPLGARCLYMTMGMLADDDGFVNAPKSIIRQTGATEDDLKILIAKKFVIPFESGVIVIKHWRINNYLQKDRIQPTKYQEEFAELTLENNGAYAKPECIQDDVYIESVYTGKDRLGKDSIGKNNNIPPTPKRGKVSEFIPPTLEEVEAYCKERGSSVDPKAFYDYFTAGDWKDSKGQQVRSWKQKLITWENKRKEQSDGTGTGRYKPASNASVVYHSPEAELPDTWHYDN